MPQFELEDIEDFYTYYVLIMGIDPNDFWQCDLDFLASVVENKGAYDGFISYEMNQM